jgi:hypothetical protein
MRFALITLLVLAAAVAGCASDSETSPAAPSPATQQGITGTWRATKAEFTSNANSSVKADIVATGSTLMLAFSGNSFTMTTTDPGAAPRITTGTWSASTDMVTMTPSGMSWSWQFDLTLNGNSLTLANGGGEFDFNADGVNEPAKLTMVLARQ